MLDDNKSWLRRRIEKALQKALTRAYETVKVDPGRFLLELRAARVLERRRGSSHAPILDAPLAGATPDHHPL